MHSRLLIFLLACLPLLASSRPWVLLFGSSDCDDCANIKARWQKAYTAPDKPVLVFADVEQGDNLSLFSDVAVHLDIPKKGASLPQMLAGRGFYAHKEAKRLIGTRELEKLSVQLKDDAFFAAVQQTADAATESVAYYVHQKTAQPPVQKDLLTVEEKTPAAVPGLLFLEQPQCKKCSLQNAALKKVQEAIPTLEITRYEVTTLEGQAMLRRVKKAFGIPDSTRNLAPLLVWHDGYAADKYLSPEEIADLLKANSAQAEFWQTPITPEELQDETSALEAFVETMTWGSAIGGGLLDGINPCAFATSIFLISYLLYLKRKKRDIVIVGVCFCIGVFLTYFFYGLVLSAVIQQLQQWQWLRQLLYGGFALVGVVFCVLHLRDAFAYRKSGKASDMSMGLGKEQHRKMHDRIKHFTEHHSCLLGPAALVLGAVISSMELTCTGQIYFPVLTALASQGMTPHFFLMLLLYNLAFILPLAVITILASSGTSAKALSDWARDHVFVSKILMAVLFALLAVLMVCMI